MKYGIPYMGSKRKIASKIMDYICDNNPNALYFYDLFGGGGAISFEALQRKQFIRVVYNELNTGVTELLKKIQRDGVTQDFYKWVSREQFKAHKNDNDWFGGLLKTCWSFGNNQTSYLFGKNIEGIKLAAHEYLINNGYDGDKNKRIVLLAEFKAIEKLAGRFELQRLEQLQQLEQLQRLEQLQQLQQLERLEQLQQLQQLEQLERLEILNLSYADVVIDTPPEQTVIYLDPQYKGKAQYKEKLDHSLLDEFVKNSNFKIYVSEYEYDLPCVLSIEHRTSLSATKNNPVIEKLFCNRQ
jgi:site-specific DNA-adenine methylase